MSIQTPEQVLQQALSRAFSLGQTYWRQADSESYKQNKLADGTYATYTQLVADTVAALSLPAAAPIDMLLFCPKCGKQHIDAPDERTPDWKNEPHRSHLCHGCGFIWRPADVPTNGVAATLTVGKNDSPRLPAAAVPTPSQLLKLIDAKNALQHAANHATPEVAEAYRSRAMEVVEIVSALASPAPAAATLINGLTQEETDATASVMGLVHPAAPSSSKDIRDGSALSASARDLVAVRQAIRDYHYALDTRQHGGVAQDKAFNAICEALGMPWIQGREATRRASTAVLAVSSELDGKGAA